MIKNNEIWKQMCFLLYELTKLKEEIHKLKMECNCHGKV